MRLPPQSVGTSRVSGGKWPEKKQKAMRSQKAADGAVEAVDSREWAEPRAGCSGLHEPLRK
ncbi:hypothetical protein T484DRAFT_1863546 [Baffinella frigidus]|nr:hypothetical protein T484DRAFT_1863546 [Cryptophyta sp. CCMP2293]